MAPLFFGAADGVNGRELWKSDGTAAGTVMVKDIRPDFGSFPLELMTLGHTLFFTADDDTHGRELWRTIHTPESSDDCKKDGWKKLTDASGGPFKNQGDCIRYLASGKKSAV